MTILLVEDHAGTADALQRLLLTCAAVERVVIATNLMDGIEKSKALRPDITILDLMLPDTKHWSETISAIHLFEPPVIVVTEVDDPDVKAAAMLAGADEVIRKSVALKMISILISAMASAGMRRLARDQRNGR